MFVAVTGTNTQQVEIVATRVFPFRSYGFPGNPSDLGSSHAWPKFDEALPKRHPLVSQTSETMVWKDCFEQLAALRNNWGVAQSTYERLIVNVADYRRGWASEYFIHTEVFRIPLG